MAGFVEYKNVVEREVNTLAKVLAGAGDYPHVIVVVARQQIARAEIYYQASKGPAAKPVRDRYLERSKNHLGMVQNLISDYRCSLFLDGVVNG